MLAAFLGCCSNIFPSSKSRVRVAHFGLGAGTAMRLMAHELPHSYHVAVEIDRGVVEAVQQELRLPSNCEIREEDALLFHCNGSKKEDSPLFDAIFVDVFDEKNFHPPHFYSTEYLKHLQQNVLGESGVIVCNLHSGGKRREACIRDAFESYSKVFQTALLFDTVDSRPNAGNTILVGSPFVVSTEDMTRNVIRYQQNNIDMSFDLKARLVSPRHVS